MPATYSYPGVYVEEVPSTVRTITGVATSITAFIGRARRGPTDRAVRVQSFGEFTRIFGGLWGLAPMTHAVSQFFQNGGGDAVIVRIFNHDGDDPPDNVNTIEFTSGGGSLVLEASSPGTWSEVLSATVDHDTRDTSDLLLFNLRVEMLDAVGGSAVSSEVFLNVSTDPQDPRFVDTVLEETSSLVRVRTSSPENASPTDGTQAATSTATDGAAITDALVTGSETPPAGMRLLDPVDLFNLMCIPPLAPGTDVANATWASAAAYCQDRRALLIIDSPAAWSASADTAVSDAETGVNTLRGTVGNDSARNAAAYYPRLRIADPLHENRLASFAPGGAVAGVMARTDSQRGVWKAPAGLDASLSGVTEFDYKLTDGGNGRLNPLGLNCLRSFPVGGNVLWGARTLAGADQLASEWKYVPVRRLALFLEESLYRGTQWVVFEPNDEPLWAQIRLNIGAFMQNLFLQGAFQGSSPRDAYFVKCDSETTTQNHIDQGIVNIHIGFAPLKPAEFVVIQIQQLAGQIQT